MRILYVSLDNTNYASRSHEVKVAEHLARRGHEVLLVAERVPKWTAEDPKPDGLTFLGEAPVNDPAAAERLGRWLPDADAGFASSASGAPALAAWKALKRRPAVAQALDVPLWRLRVGERGPWLRQWRPWFGGLAAMDRVVANTLQTREDLRAAAGLYGAPADGLPRVDVVYYGIDTEEADRSTAMAIGPPSGCVGVARLVPYKGFDLAIAALSLLPEGTRPQYHIVGDGEDAWRLAQLAMLAGLRVPDDVAFHGGVGDREKFGVIKSCTFGLYLAFNPHIPSQFPMEAAYCGLPCVVADIPINRERFGGCPGIVWCDPFDTRGVAEAVAGGAALGRGDMALMRAFVAEGRSFRSHGDGVLAVLAAAAGGKA